MSKVDRVLGWLRFGVQVFLLLIPWVCFVVGLSTGNVALLFLGLIMFAINEIREVKDKVNFIIKSFGLEERVFGQVIHEGLAQDAAGAGKDDSNTDPPANIPRH